MSIPVELVVFLLGANGALFTLLAHILLRVYNSIKNMERDIAVDNAQRNADIASLRRHTERNEQELEGLRDHLRLQPNHQH